jgi:hypothetical protein
MRGGVTEQPYEEMNVFIQWMSCGCLLMQSTPMNGKHRETEVYHEQTEERKNLRTENGRVEDR